jgi:two-component system, OmpR family, copper resistance phosphate regulon response regulator CusR
MRILVVEDEKDLNRILVKRLKLEGYVVDGCTSGTQALEYLSSAAFDAVVLDWMLPGLSGLEVVRSIRSRNPQIAVLMLTAKDQVSDKVTGLDAGADDYLVKPFATEELLARLRMLLRRTGSQNSVIMTVGDLSVDPLSRTVQRAGCIIPLSAKEFAVLEVLIRNTGIVMSRDLIQDKIAGFDAEIGSNLVDVYIRFLRRKLDEPYESKLIHTVRGVGYVLRSES